MEKELPFGVNLIFLLYIIPSILAFIFATFNLIMGILFETILSIFLIIILLLISAFGIFISISFLKAKSWARPTMIVISLLNFILLAIIQLSSLFGISANYPSSSLFLFLIIPNPFVVPIFIFHFWGLGNTFTLDLSYSLSTIFYLGVVLYLLFNKRVKEVFSKKINL